MKWHPEAAKLQLMVNQTIVYELENDLSRVSIEALAPNIVDNQLEIQVNFQNLPDDPELTVMLEYSSDNQIYYPIELISRSDGEDINETMTFTFDLNEFPESNTTTIRISIPQVIYNQFH
jgi:hypothetical protein